MTTIEKHSFSRILPNEIKTPKVVLLDYDNTLVDSWLQDFKTTNEALHALGLPPMSLEEMQRQPQIPVTQGLSILSKKPLGEVEKIYFPIYHKHHKSPAPPVPGAEELIRYLIQQEIHVSIISNKEHSLLNYTIEQIGWKKYFNAIIGAYPNKPSKPSPEIVKDATEGIQIKDKSQIWLVGDAYSTDILCAIKALITPVWVSKYSVDQLYFSKGGIAIIHAEDCCHLMRFIEETDP
jgi:phosphoglycolate phosphatase